MTVAPLRVFISYSHADKRWKDRLVADLHALPGKIEVWEDTRIDAGSEWNPEIEHEIDRADIAVLLVSDHFLQSQFILEHEVPRLLERKEKQGLRVMPLVVDGEWKGVPPWLAELQVRPRNPERPLSKRGAANSQRELTSFVLELWRIGFGETASAADHRLVSAKQLRVDLPVMAYALFPLMLALGAVLVESRVRVDTNVQVNAAAQTLSFTVAGDAPAQLLSNSTLVSRLFVEDCGVVSLPPVRLEPADGRAPHTGAVRFRCDQDIPGSKVLLRSVGSPAAHAIGALSRVPLQPGDRVRVEAAGGSPPSVRFEVSRKAGFELTLTTAPFEIVSDYAALDGTPLDAGSSTMTTYVATVADEDGLRLVEGQSSSALKLVLVPPAGGNAGPVFRSDLAVPVRDPSLVQRDPTSDRLITTIVTGQLTYPERPDIQAVPIARGDSLTLCEGCGFSLTSLSLGQDDAQALTFSLRGSVTSLRLAGIDRRLTLLDKMIGNRTALIAVGAYVVVAGLWLYRYWPRPGGDR